MKAQFVKRWVEVEKQDSGYVVKYYTTTEGGETQDLVEYTSFAVMSKDIMVFLDNKPIVNIEEKFEALKRKGNLILANPTNKVQ